jgi:hypothetical protein
MVLTDPSQTLVEESEKYVSIPEWILLHPELSAPAVRLYGVLKMYARKSERAWPGRKTLGEHMGCSDETVDKYLKQLQDAGAVEAIPRWLDRGKITLDPGPGRPQTSNLYRLRWYEPGKGEGMFSPRGGRHSSAGEGRQASAGRADVLRPEVHALEAHAPEAPQGPRERAIERAREERTDEEQQVRDRAYALAVEVVQEHGRSISLPTSTVAALFKPALTNGVEPKHLRRAAAMMVREGKPMHPNWLQEYVAKAVAGSSTLPAGW